MTKTALATPDHTGRCEQDDCPQPAEVGFYCVPHAVARHRRSAGLDAPPKASLRPSAGGSGRA